MTEKRRRGPFTKSENLGSNFLYGDDQASAKITSHINDMPSYSKEMKDLGPKEKEQKYVMLLEDGILSKDGLVVRERTIFNDQERVFCVGDPESLVVACYEVDLETLVDIVRNLKFLTISFFYPKLFII